MEDRQRSTPRITMLKKKGKRVLENADSIMTHLKAKFPTADFETLQGETIATMSVKQQVGPLINSLPMYCHHICFTQMAPAWQCHWKSCANHANLRGSNLWYSGLTLLSGMYREVNWQGQKIVYMQDCWCPSCLHYIPIASYHVTSRILAAVGSHVTDRSPDICLRCGLQLQTAAGQVTDIYSDHTLLFYIMLATVGGHITDRPSVCDVLISLM